MRPETAAAIYDAHQACTRITELVQTRTFEQVHGEWLSYSALEEAI